MRAGNISQNRAAEGPTALYAGVSRRAALPVQTAARKAMFWKTCKRDSIKQADQPLQSGPAIADQNNFAATLRHQQTFRPGFRVIPAASSSSTATTTMPAPVSTAAPATDLGDAGLGTVVPGRMKLQMSVSYLPHPSKVSYGGEDAHFLSEVRGGAIGVADGVGGWQESGINPAEYSRSLMRVACAYLEGRDVYEVAPKSNPPGPTSFKPKTLQTARQQRQEAEKEPQRPEYKLKEGGIDPQGALHVAHMLTKLPGSSTALVLQLDDSTGQLHAANLGDSGFMVVRDGAVVLQSRPLEHYFDCPHQFGSYPDFVDTTDTADGADMYTFAVQPGDIIVAGTDGLWDNCFISQILPQLPTHQGEVQDSARRIAALARKQAEDASFESPYILECQQQGFDLPIWEKVIGARFVDGRLQLKKLTGGKIDDITVIVAFAELQPGLASDIPRDEPLEETLATTTPPVTSTSPQVPEPAFEVSSEITPNNDGLRVAEGRAEGVARVPTSNSDSDPASAQLNPAALSSDLTGELANKIAVKEAQVLSSSPDSQLAKDWRVGPAAAPAVIAGV